jgi:hypothetical protein
VLTFDAGASRAEAGALARWQWSFGDGSTGQGAVVTHTYAEPGTYGVTLTVGGEQGESAMAEQSLQVRPGWLRTVLDAGAVWVEAESHTGEGGGVSRQFTGRVNAFGAVVTYWGEDIGHWLEWDVAVPAAGPYGMVLKYASGSTLAVRDVRIDGEYPGAGWQRQEFPGTGGFSATDDNWEWRTLRDPEGRPLQAELTPGPHTVRISNLEGHMALDAFVLIPLGALPSSI